MKETQVPVEWDQNTFTAPSVGRKRQKRGCVKSTVGVKMRSNSMKGLIKKGGSVSYFGCARGRQ